jgi:CHAT domain-containing protein
VFTGWEATREQFLALIGRYRILHLAAHATFDNYDPGASFLQLAERNAALHEGAVSADEIMTLNPNLDLAVLSTCNSGRVRWERGAAGLVSSFIAAGVPSVVASLWNVDDESAPEVIQRFYRYLKEGRRIGKALQLAKIDAIRLRKSDPYLWAPFVLFGLNTEVRLPEPSDSKETVELVIVLTSVLVLVFGFGWCTERRCQRGTRIGASKRARYLGRMTM